MRPARTPLLLAVVGVVLLAGCTTTEDGRGSSPRTGDAPCALAPSGVTGATRAGCGPSPTPTPTSPTPTPTTSTASALPATWAPYARTIFDTALGDPGVLNVCGIAASADLSALGGLTLTPPESTLAASCTLGIGAAATATTPSVVVSVLRAGPTRSPAPTETRVSGQTVLKYDYVAASTSCNRGLVLDLPGGATGTLSVANYGAPPGGSGEARVCALTDAVLKPFVAIAAGSTPTRRLATASPSLLSLDPCKVAQAANFFALPLLAGADSASTDFDTSCVYSSDRLGAFYVTTGLLRTPTAVPVGTAVTVGGHRLYRDTTSKSTCRYVSRQAGGEVVDAYLSPAAGVTGTVCTQSAQALGRYLDVLGLS